jgi:hypothetical protein
MTGPARRHRPRPQADSLSAIGANDYRGSMLPAHATVDAELHDLFAQAHAARTQSRLLAAQLLETQRKANENWQHIRTAWDRTEQIRAQRLAALTDPDRLRRSAFARLQAQLASMPVIEQAKGIIMAKYGWPEDQAFDALRRASQRENIKVRELATSIVARTAEGPRPAQRPHTTSTAARAAGEPRRTAAGGSRSRGRASA